VEILLAILRELLKEESQECINILSCRGSALSGSIRVRVPDIDGLVQEDDTGVGVPGEAVVFWLGVAIDGGRAKLHEQTSHGRAAWATVEPQSNWIVLWVISGLKEP